MRAYLILKMSCLNENKLEFIIVKSYFNVEGKKALYFIERRIDCKKRWMLKNLLKD